MIVVWLVLGAVMFFLAGWTARGEFDLLRRSPSGGDPIDFTRRPL